MLIQLFINLIDFLIPIIIGYFIIIKFSWNKDGLPLHLSHVSCISCAFFPYYCFFKLYVCFYFFFNFLSYLFFFFNNSYLLILLIFCKILSYHDHFYDLFLNDTFNQFFYNLYFFKLGYFYFLKNFPFTFNFFLENVFYLYISNQTFFP